MSSDASLVLGQLDSAATINDVTFNSDINNSGAISLGGGNSGLAGDQGSHLVMTPGTVFNNLPGGVVNVQGSFDNRQLTGTVLNQGTFSVLQNNLTINNDGTYFNNETGTVNIESGRTATITGTGGTFILGSLSTVGGDGTLAFGGTQIIEITSDYTFNSTTLTTDFTGGQVTVDDLGSGSTFFNGGHMVFQSDDEIFNLPFENTSFTTLDIGGSNPSTFNEVTFTEGVTNTGLIDLRGGNIGLAGDQGSSIVVVGMLMNMPGAILRASAGFDGRFINADVTNQGTIEVNQALIHNGDLTQMAGGDLDVNADYTINAGNVDLQQGIGQCRSGWRYPDH